MTQFDAQFVGILSDKRELMAIPYLQIALIVSNIIYTYN